MGNDWENRVDGKETPCVHLSGTDEHVLEAKLATAERITILAIAQAAGDPAASGCDDVSALVIGDDDNCLVAASTARFALFTQRLVASRVDKQGPVTLQVTNGGSPFPCPPPKLQGQSNDAATARHRQLRAQLERQCVCLDRTRQVLANYRDRVAFGGGCGEGAEVSAASRLLNDSLR